MSLDSLHYPAGRSGGIGVRVVPLTAPHPVLQVPAAAFTRLVRSAARVLDAPFASLSLVGDAQPFVYAPDDTDFWRARRDAPLSRTVCRFVVTQGRALQLDDVRQSPLLREDAKLWLGEAGYLGVPVRAGDGSVIGALCVADSRTRSWTPEAAEQLADIADLARLALERGDHGRAPRASVSGFVGSIGAARGRLSLRMIEKAIETMQVGVTITDSEGRILYTNPAEARMHGYTVDELRGQHARIFAPPESHRPIGADRMEQVSSWSRETVNVRKDGSVFPVLLRSDVVTDSQGRPAGLVTCCEDLTHRKALERRLLQNAFYDQLTGLPNRGLLTHRLDLAVDRVAHGEGGFSVLMVGLDRFKRVNDGLGREAGDELLRQVGERMRVCLRPDSMLARVSGDEFVILLDESGGLNDALRVAGCIQESMRLPFLLKAGEVFVTASVGIALSSSEYMKSEDVLRDATIAMYRVKDSRAGGYEVFDLNMHAQALERLRVERDLRRALDRGELGVRFQPVVSLASGRIAGFESLVRWEHPERGLIGPEDFIPLAEETGLILPIGLKVLEESCRTLRRWHQLPGWSELTMAVNLSPRQFAIAELPDRVEAVLRETGVAPRYLKLEITESVILQHSPVVSETLDRLRALGVQLFLDDFGTGYSSLSYLHRLPLDALKIDRSFVSQTAGPEAMHLVRTIVAMAQALGVSVVTEGVETAETLAALRVLQCEYAQGYYFAKPLDEAAAETMLRDNPVW
jgi:diguanylate cyclase (GGDEF)-like protein/PAS domain S-box-containing protein